MKKNRVDSKGFMLVEVIVSTVVVVTIMTSLYILFNRVYNTYELKSTYTNVDAIYTIKTIEDFFVDNMKMNDLFSDEDYKKVECNDFFSGTILYSCEDIFNQYKVSGLYLMKKQSGNELSEITGVNQTFNDYIKYLNNAVVKKEAEGYWFVIETYEIGNSDDGTADYKILNKYAYLEVK